MYRTVSEHEDPSPAFKIFRPGEIRITWDMRDVSTAIVTPTRERCKIAASVCRLPYIDFHIDDRRDCCSDATEDYYTACNIQTHAGNS
jgi:hypothetical protein